MEKQQSLFLKKYTDLLFRWKYFLIFLLLLSLPIGLAVFIKTPKVYKTSSLLSYQQQKISPNKMSPDVHARIKDIVGSLSQIVTSRTNLEKLIKTHGLYEGAVDELPMEDVIEIMRSNINIKPSKLGDTFLISYTGGDPGKVVRVTNALAAKFIEENLKYREERASETSAYTSNELQMAKAMMDRKESAMRDYKLKHYNEMPDQRDSNVSRLIALQEQYAGKQASILDLERTRVMVQEQIATRKKLIASYVAVAREKQAAAGGMSDAETSYLSQVEKLKQIKAHLETLQVKYTDNHPEIKRVKKMIVNFEKQLGMAPGEEADSQRSSSSPLLDKDILALQNQLKGIDLSIKAIEDEKVALTRRIEEHEEWVSAAPVREAEWVALTREYGELKRHYDYLVAQDLQAKSMLNLERQQKGSQFKIEDPARIPGKPIKPDFVKIMAGSVGVALGLGFGIVLVVNFLDGSFHDPDEIETYLNLPVASTVAYFATDREKRIKGFKTATINLVLCGGFVGVVALFWYAWNQGKIAL